MMDLKNGIIEIDGFEIGPNTKPEEIENNTKLNVLKKNDGRIIFDSGDNLHRIFNIDFKVRIRYDEDKTIDDIELKPIISSLSGKYSFNIGSYSETFKYFTEIRCFLDEWLEKLLGKATEYDETGNLYKFDSIYIYTYVDFVKRDNNPIGGYLTLDYYSARRK